MPKIDANQFCSFHDIRIVNEKRGYRHSYNKFFTDPKDAASVIDARSMYYRNYEHANVDFEVEEVVVIELPKRALTYMADIHNRFHGDISEGAGRRARTLLERQYEEDRIRKTVPAVAAAWEQYSLMLHLASNGL
jgi:hypothetical protein